MPNMPNVGTIRNRKSAQPVLYTKYAHGGHNAGMAKNRIAEIRETRGLSQAEVAEAIGTTVNQYGKLERGQRTLNQAWIEKIAHVFAVKPGELLDNGIILSAEQHRLLDMKNAPEQMPTRNAYRDAGPAQLNRVNLELAMGDGSNLEDWYEEEQVDFDRGWLRSITSTPADRLIVGRGVGDSMEPTIGSHDDVMINLDENRLTKLDGIYALTIEGAGAIKRLMPAGDNMIEVLSDNPAHPNRVRTYPRAAIKIIGRIVWSGRRH